MIGFEKLGFFQCRSRAMVVVRAKSTKKDVVQEQVKRGEAPLPGPPSFIFIAGVALTLAVFMHLDRRELTPDGYERAAAYAKQSPVAARRLQELMRSEHGRLTYKHLIELRDIVVAEKVARKRAQRDAGKR